MKRIRCLILVTALAVMIANGQSIQWKRYTVGSSGASMELPGKPKTQKLPITDANRKLLKLQESSSSLGPGFFVLVTYADYQPGKRPDLETALKGMATSLGDASGGKGKPQVQRLKVSGRNAALETISYVSNGQRQGLKQLIVMDGTRFWQVAVAFPPNKPSSVAAADRVIRSVKIQ